MRRQWLLIEAVAAGLLAGCAAVAVGCHLLSTLAIAGFATVGALVAGMFAERARSAERELEKAARLTAERRLADATRESGVLSAVLDGMAEGIWLTDANGVVVRHNAAIKELLFLGHDLVGHRPMTLLRSNELHEAVLKACEKGESTALELRIQGMRPRLLAVRVSPMARELSGSVAVFHDLTDLRRLEQVRKDFVANVSHELRTPVTAILGYAETLRSGALTDAEHAPGMVEIIHRQSQRLSELVDDLLELARLESRELQLQKVRVGVAEVARRAGEAVRPKADNKGIRLSFDVPLELAVEGDPRAVEQVLLNLLDNAVKYTPFGGAVRVTAKLAGEQCVLEISDTGIGIDEKHLPRVFERFYRVDKGRSRDMGGTGLGLSIVKHLVGAMGGDVRVESTAGKGSTFTVLLPAHQADRLTA